MGVGSSGAIMGILASWVVWIIFRWQKIPPECHRQRNCQLTMVASSIVITLLFSFAPFVDWGEWVGITCACYWCCWNIHFLVLLLHFALCFYTYWHTTRPSFIRPFWAIPLLSLSGAHLGGAIMGLLLALVLLTDQLDNKSHGRIIRIGSLAAGVTNHTYHHTHLIMLTHYHK